MEIKRIDSYNDKRFSQRVLDQHGCFLVDGAPFEVEIISESGAIIRGADHEVFRQLIDEFRFYTPHITCFYDENGRVVTELPRAELLTVPLNMIQPSQFYVDAEKIRAVSGFIHKPDDIIIQVLPYEGRYISLDGHTRLYYAVMNGWKAVRAVVEAADDSIYGFVDEAKKRNIFVPGDLEPVDHAQYEEKWNRFCDEYFAEHGE